MFAPDDPAALGMWRSAPARCLAAGLGAADRLFDHIYSSAFNPLYRTGTLAALSLAIALVTGVYLLFVYDVARPYESVADIQRDILLGRWMRALHRYASDAAVVAVAFHVLRLIVQGKTWGPRALAWVTGVLLAGMTMFSAVTGFVLVWDRFAHALAVAGAKMLRLLPLFPEPPDRAFVGEAPMPSQFFFMNLFLHVAIPLGMVCFLWLHTARLARAAWFPGCRVAVGTTIALVALAVAWPAPLPPPADLLVLPGRVPVDWFYAFWLPLAGASPSLGLAIALVMTGLLLGVPWLLRPSRGQVPSPAVADADLCEGCEQCLNDCPFDAIEMVTGKHPEIHPLRAQVQVDRCTSCGLCAGSCASLAIGPAQRTARHQLSAARRLVASLGDPTRMTLLVACRNNGGLAERLEHHYAGNGSLAWFPVDCAGTLHPGTVSYLGGRVGGLLVVACPSQNCQHREGASLADARMLGERRPAIPGRIAQLPVRLLHGSSADWNRLVAAIDATRGGGEAGSGPVALGCPPVAGAGRIRRGAGAVAVTGALMALVAAGSGSPQGSDADHAVLRLGWRLPGQVREHCRDLTPEEVAARPVHMRSGQECVREPLAYELTASVDGRVIARKRVRPPGLRRDRPLSVEEEFDIRPGAHAVTVTFGPETADTSGKILAYDGTVRFDRGRVVLITYDGDRLLARSSPTPRPSVP
ncbi:MAG TPA: cytochrome b N-terminal domain-containing protein [Methylomirabilota bacterium]|jgi:ferredoxin